MPPRICRLLSRRILISTALIIALASACSPSAHAQAIWTGAADPSPPNGVYSNGGNWSGTFGLVPGAGDLGIFSAGGAYTVTFTGNHALLHASVRGGTVSWLSDSATVRNFTLGRLSAGGVNQTLTIGSATNPLVVTSSNLIEAGGNLSSGSGTIVVDGASSVLNGPSVQLGGFGDLDGTLRYQNGAQGAIGGAIDLGNSTNNDSNGLLEILSGADLTSGDLNLATTTSTATGTINVSGAGSTLVQGGASTLTVGGASGGAGTINVNSGGAFTSGSGLITVNATGTINRTDAGVFNVTGSLLLDGGKFLTPGGSFSRGAGRTLTVQGSGLFAANGVNGAPPDIFTTGGPGGPGGSLTVGGGTVTLDDHASLSLAGGSGGSAFVVSQSGGGVGGTGGTLQVNGGSLLMTDQSTITLRGGNGGFSFFEPGGHGGAGGTLAVSAGSFTMDGGTVSLAGGPGGGGDPPGTAGAAGQINVTGGTFTMNGGEVTTGSFTHSGAGVFNFNGGTLHAATFNGSLVNNGGTLAPGTSAGTTTVNGDYQQSSGALAIELGGVGPGQFDVLSVTGNVALGGTLGVSLLGAFTPTIGQTWKIIDIAGTRSGSFSGLVEGAVAATFGNWQAHITYVGGDGNDVAIAAAPTTAGDFDIDGDVDGNDFLVWQRGGTPSPNSPGELAQWKGNFGFPHLAPVGAAAPEPATIVALLLGVLLPGPRRVCRKLGGIH